MMLVPWKHLFHLLDGHRSPQQAHPYFHLNSLYHKCGICIVSMQSLLLSFQRTAKKEEIFFPCWLDRHQDQKEDHRAQPRYLQPPHNPYYLCTRQNDIKAVETGPVYNSCGDNSSSQYRVQINQQRREEAFVHYSFAFSHLGLNVD